MKIWEIMLTFAFLAGLMEVVVEKALLRGLFVGLCIYGLLCSYLTWRGSQWHSKNRTREIIEMLLAGTGIGELLLSVVLAILGFKSQPSILSFFVFIFSIGMGSLAAAIFLRATVGEYDEAHQTQVRKGV